MSQDDLVRVSDQVIVTANTHNPETFIDLLADNFVWYDTTHADPITTTDEARTYVQAWFTAFPDFQAERLDRVVGTDSVATEVAITATHTGPLTFTGATLPATGRAVNFKIVFIATVMSGKVVKFSTHPDIAGIVKQLEAAPGAL